MKRIKWLACSSAIALAAIIGTAVPGFAQNVLPNQNVPPKRLAVAPGHQAAPTAAAPAGTPTAIAAPAGTPNALVTSAADVVGFRSALFGMTEAEVYNAIAKDFKIKSDAIKAEDNKAEQTRILRVQVPDVLPSGGTAEVSYVFGFKSKTLIQVGLSWSKATDDKMTSEQLFSDANVLRTHFLGAGYKPETIATNMPISGGLLMFRGNDAHDHVTMLILQGPITQGENNQRNLTPTALLLLYIVDAKSPDVYRLPTGSF